MEKSLKKQQSVGLDLTEGPIMRSLLQFAIPIVLANLVQQLYSMVDLMIIGQFVGNVGTVGVNTGGEIADLVMPVAIGFSSAGQIYIAQLFGAREEQKIRNTIGTLLTFMLLFSAVLAAGAIIFCVPILQMLNCPEEALSQARDYMVITALGMPFIFGYNAVCGILRGIGESKRPLLFIMIAAVINIVLDLVLVVVIPMEAAGTAIATTASQAGSFIAAFIYMYKKRDKFGFEFSFSYFKIRKFELVMILKLGIPQVVRSLLVRVSLLWVNATANSYGMTVSSTNGIGNKLQKILEVFVQGIDTASAAMIGQNLGAKKPDRAGKVTLNTLAAALVSAAIVSLLCIFVPQYIFGIFTKDAEVIGMGVIYLRIMIVHFIVSATIGAFQAMVTGCGFVSLGFAIGILDGVVCKIGMTLLFVYVFDMGYIGLFWGVATSRILPTILCACYYFSGKWRTRKLLTE